MTHPQDRSVVTMRPLVRYVDAEQAIVDIEFDLQNALDGAIDPDARLEVAIAMDHPDGSGFRHHDELPLHQQSGMVRFTVRRPERWWPAGMGAQALYDLSVELVLRDRVVQSWQTTIGLTSVRPAGGKREFEALLVNGHERHFDEVFPLEPSDEQHILPVGGDSLVVVRHHIGPEDLFAAADRAGILLVQAMDTTLDGARIVDEIDRLRVHPSLAGWMVRRNSLLHGVVARLDPTRRIFSDAV